MVNIIFQPEKALKKAEELLTVGQASDALTMMHGVATNKKIRQWQAAFEPMMIRHVELCVELRKGKMAKDALYQYKNLCQPNNLESLEKVMRHFLELAEGRVETARAKSEQVAVDIEDLEATQTPESIMMSSVTDEDTKDRMDREYLTPWLKFLWETYRTVLDVLRNNFKVEPVYQETAQKAFKFCLNYQRKIEFRRLCEILRNHLNSLAKYSHQINAISLNNPESLQMHLETRFAQLNAASSLELWQEAFRTIEDIHGLTLMSKKTPKLSLMTDYYEKLTQIFLVAENYLIHAFAFKKYYTMAKLNKAMAATDKQRMATMVLLSALSIPVVSATRGQYGYLDADEQQTRNMKLASYIGLSKPPTRDLLLKELVAKDIVDQAIPEIKQLYHVLEVDFDPLTLCKKVMPLTEFLEKDEKFVIYVKAIKEVTLTRLLQQLGEVYKTIKLQTIAELAPFTSMHTIEKFIMEGCKRGDFQIRINHMTQSVIFGVSSLSASSTDETLGGAHLQTVEIRSQVARLSKKLHHVIEMIEPSKQQQKEQDKLKAVQAIVPQLESEHMLTLGRKLIIEQRKIQMENLLLEKERDEMRERFQRQIKEQEAEKTRLVEESKKRDQDRYEREKAEVERQKKMKAAEELAKKSMSIGIQLKVEDIAGMSADEILRKQIEQLENEKKELKTKMNNMAKKMDHLERAQRKEEIQLLEKEFESSKKADREYHEQMYAQAYNQSKQAHEKAMEMKAKFLEIQTDAEKFREHVLELRRAAHAKKVAETNALMEAEKAQRRQDYYNEKQQELQRKKEETERKKREEEEALAAQRKKEEEAEQKRKEREEHQRKLDEIARKQREREEEVERKRLERLAKERRDKIEKALADNPPPLLEEKPIEKAAKGKYVPPSMRASTEAGGIVSKKIEKSPPPSSAPTPTPSLSSTFSPSPSPSTPSNASPPSGSPLPPETEEKPKKGAYVPPSKRQTGGNNPAPASPAASQPPVQNTGNVTGIERREDRPQRDDRLPREGDRSERRDDRPPRDAERRDERPPRAREDKPKDDGWTTVKKK